ncbi:hypothetical protein VKT23_010631 [Stygiomarasmius scandens]|uniref:Uncharacterized protein n=1 Tax=Marasmiellus scandens TaxID=2682957 RepID=A0ABR1JDG6_9AGAR
MKGLGSPPESSPSRSPPPAHQQSQEQEKPEGSPVPEPRYDSPGSINSGEDSDPSDIFTPRPRRGQRGIRRRGGIRRKAGSGEIDPNDFGVEDQGQVVRNTTDNTARKTQNTRVVGDDDSKPVRLRLDMNLDVQVQLKASVHGDLTLSLL